MEITYLLKQTPKGFTARSVLFEASIHKGLYSFGKTKDNAINNLNKKWNKIVGKDKDALLAKNNPNLKVLDFVITLKKIK